MPDTITPAPTVYLTRKEVLRRFPIGATKFWMLVKSGKFPQPVVWNADEPNNHRNLWLESEVEAHLASFQRGMGLPPIGALYLRDANRKPEPAAHRVEGTNVPSSHSRARPVLLPKAERRSRQAQGQAQ
jgi:predicted DNA-binding transcriptional regulator AlpA